MKVVFTGGGTGGHVIPNLAVIDELRSLNSDFFKEKGSKESLELLYVGSKKGMEKKLVEEFEVDYQAVSCGKLRRYFSWQNFLDFLKVPVGIFGSLRILRKFKPQVLFSKGGYVSVPVVIAAWILRIPVIMHESDFSPGLANRICAKFARKICLSFEESKKFFKSKKFKNKLLVTGNPVRKSILNGNPKKAYELTKFNSQLPVLLIMGGSAGAREISELLEKIFDELVKKFQIIHLTGKGKTTSLEAENYKQFEYLNQELTDVYAITDLVLTRGGANSLAELAILEKKVIVFPLSLNTSRGDQIENARLFAQSLGWKIIDSQTKPGEVIEIMGKLVHDKKEDNLQNKVENKIANGVEKIVELILSFRNKKKES